MSFGALGALAGAQIGKQKPPGPSGGVAGAQAGAAPPPPSAPPSALAGVQAGAQVGSQQQPGNPGGIAGANLAAIAAFKNSPAFKASLVNVFAQQGPSQKQAIVNGALKNPNTPESQAVLSYVKSLASQGGAQGAQAGAQMAAAPQFAAGGVSGSGSVSTQRGVLGDIGHYVSNLPTLGAIPGPNLVKAVTSGNAKQAASIIGGPGDNANKIASTVINKLPAVFSTAPGTQLDTLAGIGPAGASKNFAKDVASFYAESPASIGTVVADTLSNPKQGLQDVIGPYKQLMHDPQGMFLQHPFLSAMMIAAPIHGGSRALAAPVRAFAPADSALGKIVSTQRDPVHLTANLTHDRVPFSKSPTVKYGYQKGLEKALYQRNAQGQLVPKTENMRDMLINKNVSSNFQALERVRRADRAQAIADRHATITPGTGTNTLGGKLTALPWQAAHATTHLLSREPGHAAIPHADLLPLVADTTVRGLESWHGDLKAHRDKIAATTPNIQDNPRLLADQQATLKTLDKALSKPAPTPKEWARLVGATGSFGHDLHPVVAELHSRGHFGDIPQEGLVRREYQHFVQAHMPEAHIDPVLGMVRKGTADEVRAKIDTLRAQSSKLQQRLQRNFETPSPQTVSKIQDIHRAIEQTWATKSVPLETQRIVDAIKKPVREGGTGGRMPVYTPDYMKRGSAYYFPSEKFPRPATAKNTLFAYTHGLTDLHRDALTEHYVRRVAELSAHRAKGEYINSLVVGHPKGGFWTNPRAAYDMRAHDNQVPINIAPNHPANSMEAALHDVNPATVTDEAALRAMDLGAHVAEPGSEAMASNGGRWGLIDRAALKSLGENQKSINPGTLARTFRGMTTLFRTNALSLSTKHIPGVATEDLIRDAQHGIGPRSVYTGQRFFNRYEQLYGTQEARRIRAQFGGGQAAGATEALSTHSNIEHYRGTAMYPVLKGWQALVKTPGPRQLHTLWGAFTKLVIQGTKHVLEEKHQTAALGKHLLTQHGYAEAARTDGMVGTIQRMLTLHGQQLDNAVRGLHDSPQLRGEVRAVQKRFFGDWTDRTPMQRNALMFSPFGMWWLNSGSFLARMHIDAPVKSGLLASATAGTAQSRQARGLEMYGKNRLPAYQQGGIPVKGGILGQNYYSPAGMANNPFETAQSLIAPTIAPLIEGALGVDFTGKRLTSPSNPDGSKPVNDGDKGKYILHQLGDLFVPGFQKAQQALAGGASTYSVPNLLTPAIKKGQKNKGIGVGLEKAFQPYRFYPTRTQGGSGGGSVGGSGGGGSSVGGDGGGGTVGGL